jgi:vacuolar-type H+-ATPase subunit I/STV1
MKLRKMASGKETLTISKKDWIGIGKTAKWIDRSKLNKKAFDEDEWGDISQYEGMGEASSLFDNVPDEQEKRERLIAKIQSGELSEEQIDRLLDEEGISFDDLEEEDFEASQVAQEEIAREQAEEESKALAEEEAALAEEEAARARAARQRAEDEKRLQKLRGQTPIA